MMSRYSDVNPLELEFVYVGEVKPTSEKFKPIKNFNPEHYNSPNPSKPEGGLWTSPVMENGKSDWENWLEEDVSWANKTNRELFNLGYMGNERFYVIPKKGCRILCADSREKIEPYYRRRDGKVIIEHHVPLIDYEAMMKDFDAIYVPERCNEYSSPFELWSAQTLLIGNLDAFDIQTEQEHSRRKSSTIDMNMQYMCRKNFSR